MALNSYISLLLWHKCILRSQFIDQNAILKYYSDGQREAVMCQMIVILGDCYGQVQVEMPPEGCATKNVSLVSRDAVKMTLREPQMRIWCSSLLQYSNRRNRLQSENQMFLNLTLASGRTSPIIASGILNPAHAYLPCSKALHVKCRLLPEDLITSPDIGTNSVASREK